MIRYHFTSEEFEVKVGVHQGSVLSPLLFITVLEALSQEFRPGVPWEDLYADDLVIIAESLEECVRRPLTWKEAMEKKGLRVNAGKTKIMICCTGLDLLQSSGQFPCAVCCTGVGSNSIFCSGCKHWVHKKCSGLKRLKKDPDYRCTRCQGIARPLDGRPQKEVQVGPDKLEVVASFCYLGDMLSSRWLWKPPGRSSRICYQSSLHVTSLSKHVAMCTALVCGAQCSMSAGLGHWQSWTSSVCSEMTGQWSDRSAMSGRKTLSPPGPMSYLCSLALRIWTSFWRREDFDGMDMWNAPVVQSRQPLTYRLMESIGLGGPKWHGSSWQRVEALGYQPSWYVYLEIWCEICHVCSKPAIWKGAHWCGCCPCTCTLIKNLIIIMSDWYHFYFPQIYTDFTANNKIKYVTTSHCDRLVKELDSDQSSVISCEQERQFMRKFQLKYQDKTVQTLMVTFQYIL